MARALNVRGQGGQDDIGDSSSAADRARRVMVETARRCRVDPVDVRVVRRLDGMASAWRPPGDAARVDLDAGLVAGCEEDELAGVIGHELGHLYGHEEADIAVWGRRAGWCLAALALGLVSFIAGFALAIARAPGAGAVLLAGLVTLAAAAAAAARMQVQQNRLQHPKEFTADRWAAERLGVDHVRRGLAASEGQRPRSRPAEFWTGVANRGRCPHVLSHPTAARRLAALDRMRDELSANDAATR